MTQMTKLPTLLSNLPEIQQLLERLSAPNWFDRENLLNSSINSNWTPTIDVKDEKDQYIVRADIPGVDPKNIDVTLDKGMLTIKGHKETETKEERENFVHIERSSGSFYRCMSLPNASDSSKISAKTKNGVLEILIPKAKESNSHKIIVKGE
jgi:HSP20 family protein